MSSKTKIVVLRMKEIIYTAIFIGLAILLISLFLIMFRPKKSSDPGTSPASAYTPGVYTASLVLGSQNVNVEVTVDSDQIHSITLTPLSDSVATMYPLIQPVMEDLSAQIIASQSTEDLSYSMETKYTSNALIHAIETAVAKAKKES